MPKYLFFDIEATNQYWNYAHILQLAYLMLDENFEVIETYNQYFLPDEEVPASSSAVHGLTRTKLQFLSNGVIFENVADKIYEVFSDPNTIICGYNSSTYDIPLLQRELDGCGCERLIVTPDRTIDVLSQMRKKLVNATNRKLVSALSYVLTAKGIKLADINALFSDVTGSTDINFHGALYDSFITMTLYLLTKDQETV